jgi:hypothetical protein
VKGLEINPQHKEGKEGDREGGRKGGKEYR